MLVVTLCVGVSRRTSSDVHVITELNGLPPADIAFKKPDVNDNRHRYTKKQLLDVYDILQQKMGTVLTLPKGVDTTYQGLFRTDRKIIKEEDAPSKPDSVSPKQIQPETGVDGIGPEELEADSWVYKDPAGQVQGPFSKQEVLAWWEEDYFPNDLPVQSQLSAKENWVPLVKLLELWKVPTERKETEDPASGFHPTRKLEASDSLATVGSHISSALLPETTFEGREDLPTSQPPTEPASLLQSFPNQMPQQPAAFQNRVPDLQQTMQNLLLQRQTQSQQAANVGGLNFASTSLGMAGMPGLRPGMPFQQNNPYMGAYGLQQQQRPTGLQDNSFLSPAMLEAFQQRLSAQQTMNRGQLQSSPYGYDLGSGLNHPLQSQLQGNMNLAALLSQNQMAQRNAEQRSAMPSDLQRLLQARNLQAQRDSYGAMNNTLSTGMFGGMRAPYVQQQVQQNPWGNQVPGGFNALNTLLQQRPPAQQINQQQLAQAMLLNRLQGMRFPNQQQLGMPHPLSPCDDLLSCSDTTWRCTSSGHVESSQTEKQHVSPECCASVWC